MQLETGGTNAFMLKTTEDSVFFEGCITTIPVRDFA